MFSGDSTFFTDPTYRFHRGVVVEYYFPRKQRSWISMIAGLIIVLYLAVAFAPLAKEFFKDGFTFSGVPAPLAGKTVNETTVKEVADKTIPDLPRLIPFVDLSRLPVSSSVAVGDGIFFIALALWLMMRMLGWYSNSYYFYVEGLLERGATGAQTPYTTPNYEVCETYFRTRHGDLLRSFCGSRYGRMILRRSGIADHTMHDYLSKRTNIIDYRAKVTELRGIFTLRELAAALMKLDPDFYQFLFSLGIRERELAGAAEWVERVVKKRRQKKRWWGRVALGQSPAFGADLAYGGAYALSRWSKDLSRAAISGGSNFRFIYGSEEIKQLEIILSRSKEANAILVGEEGTGKMDVILDFARDIMNGYTNPALKYKRVMAFDAKGFISSVRTKQELESGLSKIFLDAAKAGNIILVIDDFPGFLQGGYALDADVMGVLSPHLSGSAIQIIATADNARYHQFIEPNGAIMQRFERVLLSEPGEESILRIVEEVAEAAERKNPIYFTYPAIVEIVRSAQSYFANAVMPDKAIDIVVEMTPAMLSKGGHLVKKLDVLEFIKEKTHIPVGAISNDERERLLNLETLMKGMVIGQESALAVIANAMRRSRAGVRNPNRPIGAFLFLGPTGVGKTETAKALAAVFFGNENAMSRIDMSEYQGDDGLSRMIGTMDGAQGTLPTMLKENPYGVVLLDEFEKTNPKVLDLFLQILDEGIFHDATGKKVNARNAIFIATSNAGAAEIRAAMKEGGALADSQKEIVDKIISSGKLKPELLNRFDGVILFHPLTNEDYRKIAEIMLRKLAKRLREKSINLVVNDILIEVLLKRGVDPDFGARPMTRAVQEIVEQKVAEKIIAGKLTPGSTLEFTREDFPELA